MSFDTLELFELIMGVYLVYAAITGRGKAYDFSGLDFDDETRARVTKKFRGIYAVCAGLCFLEVLLHYLPATSEYDTLIGVTFSGLILAVLVGSVIWLKHVEKYG